MGSGAEPHHLLILHGRHGAVLDPVHVLRSLIDRAVAESRACTRAQTRQGGSELLATASSRLICSIYRAGGHKPLCCRRHECATNFEDFSEPADRRRVLSD